MSRRAGLTIPLFSLRPSGRPAGRPAGGKGWGIGEIPDLVPFAAWARRAGFRVVQILPINEPSGGQNSPYAGRTAFAIDPVYIAVDEIEDFTAAGGVDALPAELRARLERAHAAPRVAWEDVRAVKEEALRLAYLHFVKHELARDTPRAAAFHEFCRLESDWLDDYALFAVIHDEQGSVEWTEWAPPLRFRTPSALEAARVRHAVRVDERRYVQWIADLQWHAARHAMNDKGVELMGDLPFLVGGDSADIWARALEFDLERRVGVPPDAFSEDGQDWGLPTFRWDVIAQGDFHWMRERARHNAELFDMFRVDHVVGLYRTFFRPESGPRNGPGTFTPAGEPAQTQLGETILKILDGGAHRVIAEDLGTVPDFVRASLTRLGIPGYKVMRWEKDLTVYRDPEKYPKVSVACTGTHDTESLADWYDSLDAAERAAFLKIPGLAGLRARAPEKFDAGVRDAILDCVYRSSSDLVLTPFQDAFGARERVNVPGTVNDENWTYRMPMDLAALEADTADTMRLAALAEMSSR